MGNAGIDYALVNSTFLPPLHTIHIKKKNNNPPPHYIGYVLKVSFNLRGGPLLPMLGSKVTCVLKTSLAEKSTMSLVKLRWQFTDVSGCSCEIASIWLEEQVPVLKGTIEQEICY